MNVGTRFKRAWYLFVSYCSTAGHWLFICWTEEWRRFFKKKTKNRYILVWCLLIEIFFDLPCLLKTWPNMAPHSLLSFVAPFQFLPLCVPLAQVRQVGYSLFLSASILLLYVPWVSNSQTFMMCLGKFQLTFLILCVTELLVTVFLKTSSLITCPVHGILSILLLTHISVAWHFLILRISLIFVFIFHKTFSLFTRSVDDIDSILR